MHPIHPAVRAAACGLILAATAAFAQTTTTLHGHVLDPLGAAVPNAKVYLVANNESKTILDATKSGADGSYSFVISQSHLYRIGATAPTFREVLTAPIFLSAGASTTEDITLATPTLTQEVSVTTGTPTPLAQSGAPITILSQADFANTLEVQDPLRLVPGVQITTEGQVGGESSLFLRGGNSESTKVLVDGVPVNDIGSLADLSTHASTGISQIEVLRQPVSVLYGSDNVAGVVWLTTERGATPLPLLTYSVDGGNLGTLRQQVSIGGAHSHFDYDTGVSAFQTSNSTPHADFHSTTEFGNYGYDPDSRTDVRFTFRHIDTNAGDPNAFAFYGIPDLVNQFYKETFLNGTAQQQTAPNWHNLLRYGWQSLDYDHVQYAENGTEDPNVYGTIGNPVTIAGANGYSVSGQAELDYDGRYPASSPSTARRDFVYAQSDYRVNHFLTALGSFQYEAEDGKSNYASARRGNYSYTLQVSGDAFNRLFYVLGSGIEDNAVYGKSLTPRASVAFYAVRPYTTKLFSGTKLHASFGKGIVEPSIGEQVSSLYGFFASSGDLAQAAQYGIGPLGGEYSRTYDAGVEQQFGDERARLNLTWFHNEYTNVLEYVPAPQGLQALGLPAAVYNNPSIYGAYVNSQAYRAEGAELESEFRLAHHLFARAGYTYLDAVVQRSFSSDALGPTFNTNFDFPTVPIGVYSPLIGARPFRRAPQSGYFSLQYAQDRFNAQLSGTLVGRRDDSTYLGYADANGGNSLLLPNRNLDGAYQRLELSADYRINHHLTTYADIQNVLDESYYEAFGYPALPITVRGGLRFTFGGESFSLK
jgi:iron complex outermembrane receptor protein/vitamin B12 transporter